MTNGTRKYYQTLADELQEFLASIADSASATPAPASAGLRLVVTDASGMQSRSQRMHYRDTLEIAADLRGFLDYLDKAIARTPACPERDELVLALRQGREHWARLIDELEVEAE